MRGCSSSTTRATYGCATSSWATCAPATAWAVVVAFKRSRNVRISNSELFGSGTIGVGLTNVHGFDMTGSVIHDCTYGILSIKSSSRVRFARSTFRNNREFDLIEISGSRNVRFDHCTVSQNHTTRGGGYALFKLDKKSSIIIRGGQFRRNRVDTFINRPGRMRVIGSAQFERTLRRKLHRGDLRFNQIYRVTRYRRWIVTGTQAGIVFWNPRTGQVDLLQKAFISNSFLVDGKYLWAGTYRNVWGWEAGTHWYGYTAVAAPGSANASSSTNPDYSRGASALAKSLAPQPISPLLQIHPVFTAIADSAVNPESSPIIERPRE